MVAGTRRPYWEAGRPYAPWAGGYFGGYAYGGFGMGALLPGLLVDTMLGNSMGGFGGDFGAGGDF